MSRVWNNIYRNTNASYTSVASFLDGDYLPNYGEKLGASLLGLRFRARKHRPYGPMIGNRHRKE
ncbi:hypothetical protein [Okeania sp. KiyG1]|uniref:hypothetical protein n=1 Tax=Okeania sp. KiyG1 TaxID=2720165 RepID=UPI001920CB7F|nr:hypothetical protein [Okeania sp. KiyG1]